MIPKKIIKNIYTQKQPFALCAQWGNIRCLFWWSISHCNVIEDIPDHSLALLPFSQIREQWYVYTKERHPIIVLNDYKEYLSTADEYVNSAPITKELCSLVWSIKTSVSDKNYINLVDQLKQEIKNWSCSNIVLSRKFIGQLWWDIHIWLLSLYRQLVLSEPNAAMNYLIFDGTRYIIWSSPEIQLSYHNGLVSMMPISGTTSKTLGDGNGSLIAFLRNHKEIYELFMVTDETTKIMSRICDGWYKIMWPYIRDMATVIHTEYHLTGITSKSAKESLRMSCFVPTLVWSPLESTSSLIQQYETDDRWYYGWCVVQYDNEHHVDSTILIRTAYVDLDGSFVIQTGATITKESDSAAESLETRAKAASMICLFQWWLARCSTIPMSRATSNVFTDRNKVLNNFYTQVSLYIQYHKKFLLLHNGDDFIYMLSDILHSFGIVTDIIQMESYTCSAWYDCVVIWPGPGDPKTMHMKYIIVQWLLDEANAGRIFLLWICLWHQLLASVIWYQLIKKEVCTQWAVWHIVCENKKYLVWYYNSFGVILPRSWFALDYFDQIIYGQDWYIDMFLGGRIASTQFHPESILSHDGIDILIYIFSKWRWA